MTAPTAYPHCEAPKGPLSVRLYRCMTAGEIAGFFAPDAAGHDCRDACRFLRSLADEMERYQKEEYPDGLPF